jgi:hypothetical protein
MMGCTHRTLADPWMHLQTLRRQTNLDISPTMQGA